MVKFFFYRKNKYVFLPSKNFKNKSTIVEIISKKLYFVNLPVEKG